MATDSGDNKTGLDTKPESVTADETVEAANDHPKGLAFSLIILALVLSIFLASLDMVSTLAVGVGSCQDSLTITDHRRNCDSQNHR